MSVELLSLSVIGWLYTIGCAAALLLGGYLVIGVHFSGEEARKHLAARARDDAILFGIWLLGLAGGIGLLLGKPWSRPVLELFCWVLAVLLLLTAATRYRAAPHPRGMLALSLALFVVPLLAVLGATILALRATIP